MVMWKKRIPAYLMLPALVVGGLLSWAALSGANGRAPRSTAHAAGTRPPQAAVEPADCDGPYVMKRMPGFKLTHPLLYSEPIKPALQYESMRDSLAAVIDRSKARGKVRSAAVYVRDFDRSYWTGVNLSEAFDPGSMLKVTVMMYWLERAMRQPAVLDQRFEFVPVNDPRIPAPRIEGPHVQAGQWYTVRELLRYMVVHSDNNATLVLNRNMDAQRFASLFEELGLARPQMDAARYPMNCRDLAVFLKTLYNSGVLTPEYSEMALALLSESSFTDGLRKGVPADVPVVHKFGEAGSPQEIQLHEVGIVYLPGKNYLISVMSRGNNLADQKALIAELSACAYRRMAALR